MNNFILQGVDIYDIQLRILQTLLSLITDLVIVQKIIVQHVQLNFDD